MIVISSPSALADSILAADVAILSFSAPWCAPCRALAPSLETLEQKNPGVVFGKVNVDDNPALAKAAGIRGIPALVLYKKGETIGMLTGSQSLDALQAFVDRALS